MSTLCEVVPQAQDVPDLIPARMLNEFAYCPRLAYLKWVQGEFADNLDVLEGRFGHRRVDQPTARNCRRPMSPTAGPSPARAEGTVATVTRTPQRRRPPDGGWRRRRTRSMPARSCSPLPAKG